MAAGPAAPAGEGGRPELHRMRALRDAGRFDEALALLRDLIRDDPDDAEALHNLGMLLAQLGRLAEGEPPLRRAAQLLPDEAAIAFILATTLLAQGKVDEGWPLFRARLNIPSAHIPVPAAFPFPAWNGEDLAGRRIVLFPEQGLGDQIQFARFLPALRQQGAAVILLAREPLVRLLRGSFPDVTVLPASGAVDFPDPDFWAMSLDLGLIAKTPALPRPPYLRAPAAPQLDLGGVRVGLMTSGNPAFLHDRRRSLPPEMAERLRRALPVPSMSLDPAQTGARDLADTAAIIERLDLVIAVDTAVAHLAGAMGKPCLVMLPGFGTDWRWMTDRSDSPWYPSLRLYRTALDGEWGPVIERVAADAALLLSGEATLPRLIARDHMASAATARARGDLSGSLHHSRGAVAADPDNGAALHNLAQELLLIGNLAESEAAARKALAQAREAPLLRVGLARVLMAQGKLAEGLPLYRARTEVHEAKVWSPQGFDFPRWRGEPIAGKRLAIFPEQGLGDQIQFSRFLPELAKQAARITLLALPSLAALFAESFPEVEVVEATGATAFPDPDLWATTYDLADMAGATLETLPQPPYLTTTRQGPALPPGARIGLMTRGHPGYGNDTRRSLSDAEGEALRRRLPGEVIDLRPESTGARDFADTAALVKQLDAVVSVDTSVSHLAGALDKPCFLLVPGIQTDWRWMRGRDDSPWYPHHRLYRGTLEGDWSGAIDRLVRDVQERIG